MDAHPIATLDAPPDHPQDFFVYDKPIPSPHVSFPPGRFGLIRADSVRSRLDDQQVARLIQAEPIPNLRPRSGRLGMVGAGSMTVGRWVNLSRRGLCWRSFGWGDHSQRPSAI